MPRLLGLCLLMLTACPPSTGPFDDDLDGFTDDVDCDDSDPNVNPGADELCANQIDDDCDGSIDDDGLGAGVYYLDADEDSFGDDDHSVRACTAPEGYVNNADDCDDTVYEVNPSAVDDTCDGVDDDCNGRVDDKAAQITAWPDKDDDGYGGGASVQACKVPEGHADNSDDCDDTDPDQHPGATERCNGEDDDCDTEVDEGTLGSAEACPVESCKALLAAQPGTRDGEYWIAFGDEARQLTCEMEGSGTQGWTVLTGEDLRALDLVEFTLVGGRADNWTAEWVFAEGVGHFIMHPWRGDLDRTDCETAVIKAEVRLPWAFDAWYGEFTAEYHGQDNFVSTPGTRTSVCDRGAFSLVSGVSYAKPPNRWPDSTGETRSWSWEPTTLPSSQDVFFWDLNGYSTSGTPKAGEEFANVGNIRIAVH